MITQIDGIRFELRESFDFGFLDRWGSVFRIFDRQDSGNICFGMEKNGEKVFVKFAGAPTLRYDGTPSDAIMRLRQAEPIYRDLRHPALIELVESAKVGGGYALVFRWEDGECMGRMYPESHRRFMALAVNEREQVFRDALRFLVHTASCGYTAVDFYDGSILYDAKRKRTVICDVDFFRRQPCVNDMGQMWGSSRFMSPEEYELGAALDERTNVFTAGAMAFSILTDSDFSKEQWPLEQGLYLAAKRAMDPEREKRFATLGEFEKAWEEAQ